MSTLQVSNISDGTTTVGTEYVVNGSAKAWVNFNGTGTISTREDLNVSSLTDNGTGDYSTNFTNNMGGSNFVVGLSATDDGTTSGQTNGFSYGSWAKGPNSAGYAAGSMRFQIGYPANNDLYDQTHINLTVHGDLA